MTWNLHEVASSGFDTDDLIDEYLYPGVSIELNDYLERSYMNPYTRTIHLPHWVKTDDAYKSYILQRDLTLHEYGHFLQLKEMGFTRFAIWVMYPSLFSSKSDDHMYNDYEIDANIRAEKYYRSRFPYAHKVFSDTITYKTRYHHLIKKSK